MLGSFVAGAFLILADRRVVLEPAPGRGRVTFAVPAGFTLAQREAARATLQSGSADLTLSWSLKAIDPPMRKAIGEYVTESRKKSLVVSELAVGRYRGWLVKVPVVSDGSTFPISYHAALIDGPHLLSLTYYDKVGQKIPDAQAVRLIQAFCKSGRVLTK